MDWTVPSALVAGRLLLGLLAERFVLPRLQRYAVARRWVGGDLLIGSLHGVTLAFSLIAGIYIALLAMGTSCLRTVGAWTSGGGPKPFLRPRSSRT